MEIRKVCEQYFDTADIKKAFSPQTASVKKIVLASLKIFSIVTGVPLVMGAVYALSKRTALLDGSSPKSAKKVSDLSNSHFHIVGGGIAGLNTALLLMQKGISGKQITIYEGNKECGGLYYKNVSEDGRSFYAHTVRTFDEPSYQYTQKAWRQAGIWNSKHLINRNFAQPRETLSSDVRKAFLAIADKSDKELEKKSIGDLLPQKTLKSPLCRYCFHLTGFSEHHSVLALKRYMTHTHANVPDNWMLRSAACDYDSIVDPIVTYLKSESVQIQTEKPVKKLDIRDKHVHAIDDMPLGPDDKVIMTVGANVNKELFPDPKEVLLYNKTKSPIAPCTPLETSKRQPHSSVWLLAHKDLAKKIEERFPGTEERDFIHIDVEHPWQITLISLGDKYYKQQPKDHRLYYIAMNDLSKKGLHVHTPGTKCTEAELAEEALKRLEIWDIVNQAPEKYTATVDSRARQFADHDSAPVVRFIPGESDKILLYPDTQCDNLAVIGERVRAYQAPVPTTEWVTETGHRAIQYLTEGERYRMSSRAFRVQEWKHSWQFIWNRVKFNLKLGGPNFVSSVN